MGEQGFLFDEFQAAMARLLGRLLQLHHRHISALERSALEIALPDRPVEQVPEPFEKSVSADDSPDAPNSTHRLDLQCWSV
jgi:hypothetical protein